jgi:ABC-type dipeptide/oligopeptide/nickel transport system ATPase subunit
MSRFRSVGKKRPALAMARVDAKSMTATRGGCGATCSLIFQDSVASQNARMTVSEIITEPLEVHQIGDKFSQQTEMYRLLDHVGLPRSAASRKSHEFSGGQS